MYSKIIITLFAISTASWANAQLLNSLPSEAKESVLWYADFEEGTLDDFTSTKSGAAGGQIIMQGGKDVQALADKRFAHSGQYSAKAYIKNASKAENGEKGIKFVRYSDDEAGNNLPKDGYYSSFFYFPHIYNPTKKSDWSSDDEGYWNLFEFATSDDSGNLDSQWSLNVHHDSGTNKMFLFLRSHKGVKSKYLQLASTRTAIPVNKWMHLETRYKQSEGNDKNGSITVWQDGNLIFDIESISTAVEGKNISWIVGSATDHIDGESVEGRATLYIDDNMISSNAIHPYLEAVVALPLELVSFDVSTAGNDVKVNWKTANESNIKYYIVQRRHESESDYKEINMLTALNDDSENWNEYDALDLESKRTGVYYYRLRVLDNDGQEYYSDLQSITIRGGNFYGLEIHPNPVQNEVYIEGLGDEEELLIINIFDIYGKLMISSSEVASLTGNIEVSNLIPGIYVIQVSKGLDRYSKKIIKI